MLTTTQTTERNALLSAAYFAGPCEQPAAYAAVVAWAEETLGWFEMSPNFSERFLARVRDAV